MEVAKLFNKEYEIKERQDGTLVLKPIIRPSDKRNALKEYTTQELVDEVWRRTDEELKKEKEEAEQWKNIVLFDGDEDPTQS